MQEGEGCSWGRAGEPHPHPEREDHRGNGAVRKQWGQSHGYRWGSGRDAPQTQPGRSPGSRCTRSRVGQAATRGTRVQPTSPWTPSSQKLQRGQQSHRVGGGGQLYVQGIIPQGNTDQLPCGLQLALSSGHDVERKVSTKGHPAVPEYH